MKNTFGNFYWIILDLTLINLSIFFSLLLVFESRLVEYLYVYREIFPAFSISFLLSAIFFKLYQRIWRYLSVSDLLLLIKVVSVGMFVSSISLIWMRGIVFYLTMLVLIWFFSLGLIGGSRLAWRLYCERHGFSKKGEDRILIVGAGDSGEVISREIIKNPSLGKLVGFVDDNKEKLGKIIHNARVLCNIEGINRIIEKKLINTVIIAIPSASGMEIKRIIDNIKDKIIKIRTLPGLDELLDGKVSISRIRKVRIEDLLGRKQVELNLDEISKYIKGKNVLITGGGGSIGKELCRQVCRFSPHKLILLDHSEYGLFQINLEIKTKWPKLEFNLVIADIRERKKIERVFKEYKPNVIFHAAAYKHVPLMEYHPDEAIGSNIIGTKNVAELANKYGTERMVMISTDKAINPTSVMGASKRVAEMVIKNLNDNHFEIYKNKKKTKYVAVRFGNVLESNGSVIHIFKRQIAEGGPVTITDKRMKRYFMTLPEASQLVLQAGSLGKGGEVFVLDMGDPVNVLDVAKHLILLSGLVPDEDIEVKSIGVRPGEKLFEELLTLEEKTRGLGVSGHEKIFIAQSDNVDRDKLEENIKELQVFAKEMNMDGIIKKLQKIVPSYKPNRWMLK